MKILNTDQISLFKFSIDNIKDYKYLEINFKPY